MTARPVRQLERVMGTVITIDIYPLAARDTSRPGQAHAAGNVLADTAQAAATQADAVHANDLRRHLARARVVLEQAETAFSTWLPGSPVSRLRRGEITIAAAPPEVAAVMSACATARRLSGGWFDPWAMPGGFDPTGYVKGWAAQRALAALDGLTISGALVNAAGDIASTGVQPSGEPFRIGIADPADARRLAEVVELTGCIATSGTYERGSHLVDPWTGQPAARVASASVTGPDLGLADALATALAVAGEAGLAFIEPLAGYEALIIGYDGRKQSTSQFPFAPHVVAGSARAR